MADDQLTKLFRYMQAEFGKIHVDMDQRFAEVHARIDKVYTLLDKVAEVQLADRQERMMMYHQLQRHDNWIEQAAQKIDVPYRH